MEWDNLKDKKCPKCGGRLYESGTAYRCTNDAVFNPCSYRISFDRFNEVVNDLYRPKRRFMRRISEEENLRELNNL